MQSWSRAVSALEPFATSPDSRTKLYHAELAGEEVVVKQVICDDEYSARNLVSRAHLGMDAQALWHMHIVPPLTCACEKRLGGGYYAHIVTKRMKKSLADDVVERCVRHLKYDECLLRKYLSDMINAFAFLQAKNVQFRDISLEHIFLNENGEVFVANLGFTLEASDESLVEQPFISPKLREALLRGELNLASIPHNSYKSDVYSLGIVMLMLTTLEKPVLLSNLEDLQQHINQYIDDIGDFTTEWREMLSWMLTVEEVHRPDFIRLAEYLADQEPFADDEPFQELQVEDVFEPLTLTAKCGLSYARMSSEYSDDIPFLISLKASGEEEAKRLYSLDLVCAIDVSGSMYCEGLFEVQDALTEIVERMTCYDRVSIVTFSDSAKRQCPLILCTEPGKEKLKECINSLMCEDLTNITSGFQCALKVLKQRRYKNSFSSLLLLTDGNNNAGSPLESCSEALQRAGIDNLSVFIIGVGSELNAKELIDLASKGDGCYFSSEMRHEIQPCFKLAFVSITNVVARRIKISIVPSQIATVRFTLKRVYAQQYPSDQEAKFGVRDLESGGDRQVILILQPEKRDLRGGFGETIASCVVSYRTNEGQSVTCSAPLDVKFRRWQSAPPTQDKNVYEHFYKEKGAEYLEAALAYYTNGDTENAAKMIKYGIEFLASGLCSEFPLVKRVIEKLEEARARLGLPSCENFLVSMRYSILSQTAMSPSSVSMTPQQQRILQFTK